MVNLELRTYSRNKYRELYTKYRSYYDEVQKAGEQILKDARVIALENGILRGKAAELERKVKVLTEQRTTKFKIGDKVRIVSNELTQRDYSGVNWMDKEEEHARSTRIGRELIVRNVNREEYIRCGGLLFWHPSEKFELVEPVKTK